MKKKYNDGGAIGKGISDAMKKEPATTKLKNEKEENQENIEKHGLKGRVSAKSRRDHEDYLGGYRVGLKYGEENFHAKGDAKENTIFSAAEEKLQKTMGGKKSHEGFKKGIADMDAALKGQGAYKKGGKVKKMAKGGSVRGMGCEVRGKTKGRFV